MDPTRFDALARALSQVRDRRQLVALVASLPLAGVLTGLTVDESGAEKPRDRIKRRKDANRRKRRNRKHQGKNHGNTRNGGGKGGKRPGNCTPDGGACQQNSDCCGGNCFSQVCASTANQCGGVNCPAGATGCCGGTCCTAPSNQCDATAQCCAPDCNGKQCGPDGCGNAGTCGTCPANESCNGAGQCVPTCTVCGSGCAFTSVQAAIDAAAAGATIAVCPGTYKEHLTISKDLTLAGAGGAVTLDGGGSGRVVEVPRGVTATIASLTIANGAALGTGNDGFGGGIDNDGDLTLRNVIVQNNVAFVGGGISNDNLASLTLDATTVRQNEARHDEGDGYSGKGGGIFTQSVLVVDRSSVISLNTALTGGGIFNSQGGPNTNTVTVSGGSHITGNTATQDGGGIYNFEADVTIDGSSVVSNTATRNGGGIYNEAAGLTATLLLRNNAVIGQNQARSGGGIYNRLLEGADAAPVTIIDSAVSDNTVSELGGGILNNGGTLTLQSGTIFENTAGATGNTGGGIFNTGGGVVTLDNQSAVADNDPDDCVGTTACEV